MITLATALTALCGFCAAQSATVNIPEPVPGRITADEPLDRFNAQCLTLSNGVKVYLKHTTFKKDTFTIMGTMPGGMSLYINDQNGASFRAFNMALAVSDFGGYNAYDLKKIMKQAGVVSMRTSVDKTDAGFSGVTSRAGAEVALRILRLKMAQPQRNDSMFQRFIDNNRKWFTTRKPDPKYEFADSIFANVFGHHALGAEKLSPADLDQVDYGLILDTQKKIFADMTGLEVFIVGDYDLATLRPLLEKYVASMPCSGTPHETRDIGYRLFSGNPDVKWTASLPSEQDKVYDFWTADATYKLKNTLIVKMTGRIMADRFLHELRDQRGWLKHVDCHASVVSSMNGIDGPVIFFPLNATVPAGKAAEAQKAVNAVMASAVRNGVTANELQEQKDYFKKVRRETLNSNGYWMTMLQVWVAYQQDFDKDYDQVLNSITRADLRQFLANLLAKGRHLQLTMTAPAK